MIYRYKEQSHHTVKTKNRAQARTRAASNCLLKKPLAAELFYRKRRSLFFVTFCFGLDWRVQIMPKGELYIQWYTIALAMDKKIEWFRWHYFSEISTSLMWNNFCRNCEIENYHFLWNEINPHAARRISHCEAIFHARRVFHKSWKDLFRWKKRTEFFSTLFSWWERVDSNHRSYKQQIYSLSPLATRELSHINF